MQVDGVCVVRELVYQRISEREWKKEKEEIKRKQGIQQNKKNRKK